MKRYFSQLILSLILIFAICPLHAQHLFGNPECSAWQRLDDKQKTLWLNAFLVPLNLTNVARKKPVKDVFTHLGSLEPAKIYVDHFCLQHTDSMASIGAIQYLEELTAEK
jgi:hypothetical protein